jgi:hypothetical protein
MSKEYPLFPALPEEAQKEAQEILNSFKAAMKDICDDTLSKLYTDVAVYIESDSWTNFRNELLGGLQNYGNRKIQAEYDFKTIRQAILDENREDIIKDLNQDMVAEIESLKKDLEREREFRRGY